MFEGVVKGLAFFQLDRPDKLLYESFISIDSRSRLVSSGSVDGTDSIYPDDFTAVRRIGPGEDDGDALWTAKLQLTR